MLNVWYPAVIKAFAAAKAEKAAVSSEVAEQGEAKTGLEFVG
jgi:hypothetical protein